MRLKSLCFSLLLLLFLSSASAQVSVDRVYIRFVPQGRPVQNVVVKNNGNETVYLQVVSDEIENPGDEDEARVSTTKLITSPKRFSLKPGAERTVRLLLKEKFGQQEQVYRVKFLPQDKGFGESSEGEAPRRQTQVKVIFSVGIIIFADPLDPLPLIKREVKGRDIVFRNEGNVNALYQEIKHCAGPDKDCIELPSKRLYPGNDWTLTVPAKRIVFMERQIGDEVEAIEINT